MSSSNLKASDFIQFHKPTTPILFEDLKDLPFVTINEFDGIQLKRTTNQKRLEVDITKVLLQMKTEEVVDERSHHYYDCFLKDDGYIDYVSVVRNNSLGVLNWILYDVLEISKT